MSDPNSTPGGGTRYPICSVEVYPFEGGKYFIQGGQILACTTNKNFTQSAGVFEIDLAPGGPNGPNSILSWIDIITPISFVLIGMQRDKFTQIVMIGVVTHITEVESWNVGQPVSRITRILGQDFSYFFNSFNHVVLSFLGSATTAVLGQQLGNAAAGFAAALSLSTLHGTPDQVGKNWYTQVMDGTQGVLSRTVIAYQQSRLSFSDVLAGTFEKYPGFSFPLGDFYIASEGTWMEKFRAIFEWPQYEFFVTTAPSGFYEGFMTNDKTSISAGKTFSMQKFGNNVKAAPTMIARVNPLPHVKVEVSGNSLKFTGLDNAAWKKLTLYTPTVFDSAPLTITTQFQIDEVRNFYMLLPSWLEAKFGIGNANTIPFIYLFTAAEDPASIHRFGYHPEIHQTHWMDDMNGATSQQYPTDQTPVQNSYGDILSRLFSYYEPTSLMMHSSTKMMLRPDIMPGCRFQFQCLKNEPPWQFYIDGVSHKFIFGGECCTTLSLSRGLPASVYNDSGSDGVLYNLHVGNAQRLNGTYQKGLPTEPGGAAAQGLKTLNMADDGTLQALGDIAKVYQTPQAK